MKLKCLIIILMMLLIFPLVYSIEECKGVMLPSSRDIPCSIISSWQFPSDCNTYTVKIFYSNATPNLLDTRTMGDYGVTNRCNITFNYTTKGSYVLNWSSGDSSKIILEGKDEMASLSVMLFVGAITFALFFIGFKYDLSKSRFANFVLKRCCILFGLFLLSLDTGMVATIADTAGLGINREIFRYLWIINWTIYLFMVYLFWNTLLLGLDLWKDIARQKRMGDDGD